MYQYYYMPTQIISGENCLCESAEILTGLGKRVFLVTGAHSARISGALQDAEIALTKIGCTWKVFDRVPTNPTISCVYEGAEAARNFGADFVFAIGGGSPMDAGKAIALVAKNPYLPKEALFRGIYSGGALPIVCVPTTAGTGSEVTKASILTNDYAQTKSSISHPLLFPRVAFVDGRYTLKLPIHITINTMIDALTHATEGILSNKASELTNSLACEALSHISNCLRTIKQEGKLTAQQRQSLILASTEAGIVIANTGTTAIHAMGYSLTYFKHIDHGRANGLLFAAFLEWMQTRTPLHIHKILSCLNFHSIEDLRTMFSELLGKPETLTKEEAEEYASHAIHAGNIRNCLCTPQESDLFQIYCKSFGL